MEQTPHQPMLPEHLVTVWLVPGSFDSGRGLELSPTVKPTSLTARHPISEANKMTGPSLLLPDVPGFPW